MGNRNSGPRPTPTALKVLRGFRKDRINQHEPKPPSDPVVKPASLSHAAGLIWDRLAPVCLTMQTLTCADLDAFGALCELVATLQCATREKDRPRFRPIVKGRAHPALRLERETAAALRPYFEKFGLDPVGRARITLPAAPPEPVADKWAGLLP